MTPNTTSNDRRRRNKEEKTTLLYLLGREINFYFFYLSLTLSPFNLFSFLHPFFLSYTNFKINTPHCKGKIPKFRTKYSQKRHIGVSVPISTFMRLCVIYIFPWSVCLFCWRKYLDRSWDYKNRSQTHECGNWGWGRVIPIKGIHKWDFHCSAPIGFASNHLIICSCPWMSNLPEELYKDENGYHQTQKSIPYFLAPKLCTKLSADVYILITLYTVYKNCT